MFEWSWSVERFFPLLVLCFCAILEVCEVDDVSDGVRAVDSSRRSAEKGRQWRVSVGGLHVTVSGARESVASARPRFAGFAASPRRIPGRESLTSAAGAAVAVFLN